MYILKIDWYDNGNVDYFEHPTLEDVNIQVGAIRISHPSFKYSIYEMV